MLNIPGVVAALVLLLAGLHGLREWVLTDDTMLWEMAFIPARFAMMFGVDPVQALADRLAAEPDSAEAVWRVALARELAAEGATKPRTALSYALLHASWTHLIVNTIWLVAFGSAVARRFGAARFLAFMALTAVGGAAGHFLTNAEDVTPMIGASAAISGCMAAALRFAFRPGAPLGGFSLGGDDAYRLPAMRLADVLRDRRSLTFLLVWLVMNVATGLGASELRLTDAAIAWQAHMGGFIVGLLAFPLLDPPPLRPAA
nr:rhomboid family intramembrane serine protease [Alsobacter ponti]